MKEIIWCLIGGISGGLMISILTVDQRANSIAYERVINYCQIPLPRSQKCIITAVPEVTE